MSEKISLDSSAENKIINMYCSSIKVVIFCLRKACSSVEVYKNLPFFRFGCSFASNLIMSVKTNVQL